LIENKYLFPLPVLEPRQDTVDAIKAFQKDKSFPVTGRIDRAQFELLEKGVGEISADINLPPGEPYVYLPGIMPGSRYASIRRGTWSSKLPTTADPAGWPNVAEIRCDKSTRRCIESDAEIIGTGPGVLTVDANVC